MSSIWYQQNSGFYYNGVEPKSPVDFLTSLSKATSASEIQMRLEICPQKLTIGDFHWLLIEIIGQNISKPYNQKNVDAFVQFISTNTNAISKTGSKGFIRRCHREIKWTDVSSNSSSLNTIRLMIISKVLEAATRNWLSMNSQKEAK